MKGAAKQDDPDVWAEQAEKHEGSWWLDWGEMLKKNSGKAVKAPKVPGNKDYSPLGSVRGTYVFEP